MSNPEGVAQYIKAEIKRRRRIEGGPFRGFEHEEELTPTEWRDAMTIFARAKHSSSLRDGLNKLRERALARAARSSGNDTAPGFKHTRPSPMVIHEPLVTPMQVISGLAIVTGAFFIGRWWARRRKTQPASPVRLHGLDVFTAS